MARISLQEQYDNKDVIHQIYGLKETVADAIEQIDTAVTTANEASATATSMGARLTAVEEGQATVSAKADAAVKAEVKGVTVDAEGTDGFSVTLSKAEGSFNSGKFNLGKVKRASIHKGTALNSIYFQLELTDGTTVRSADAVIDISGVETDIHVTGLTLYEDPDSHGIYAVFAMNDGSTVRSNTIEYDYPGTATSNVKGLVKGSTADGGVAVDSDGIMSVNGYADLKTRVSGTESRVSRVEDRTNGTERDIETINGTTIPGLRSEMTTADTALRQSIQANTDTLAGHTTTLAELGSRLDTVTNDTNELKTVVGSEEIPEGTIKFNINSIWENVNSINETVGSHTDRLDTVEPKVTKNTDRLANMMTSQYGRADSFYIGKEDVGYHYRFTNWPVNYVDGSRWILIVDEAYMGTVKQSNRTSGSKILNVWLTEELKSSTDVKLVVSPAYPEGGRIVWSEKAFSQFAKTSPTGLIPRVTRLEDDMTTVKETQGNHETRIHANETSISTLNTSVNANTTSVTGLTESVGTLTNSVNTLSSTVNGKQDALTAGTGIIISEENVISMSQGTDGINVRITPYTATTGPISEIDVNGNISSRYSYYIKFKFAKGTLRRDDFVKANNSVVDVIGNYTVDVQKVAPFCAINFTNPSDYDEVDIYMQNAWPNNSPAANDLIDPFTFIRVVY